jgi:hypothetical protein
LTPTYAHIADDPDSKKDIPLTDCLYDVSEDYNMPYLYMAYGTKDQEIPSKKCKALFGSMNLDKLETWFMVDFATGLTLSYNTTRMVSLSIS